MSDRVKRSIGRAMIAAPFAGIAVLGIVSIGLWATVLIAVGTVALLGWILFAVELSQ